MARHAGRAAYAIDVSACFPAPIVGLIFAVADAQSWRSEHLAPPRHRRRLRRSYRPRRLVGQRAAAAGERSAKVAEAAVTFLKDFALSSEMKVARRLTASIPSTGAMLPDTPIVRRPGSSAPPPGRWPAPPRPCPYPGRHTALRQKRIRRHHPVFAAPTALPVFWEWHRNRRPVRKGHCPS